MERKGAERRGMSGQSRFVELRQGAVRYSWERLGMEWQSWCGRER